MNARTLEEISRSYRQQTDPLPYIPAKLPGKDDSSGPIKAWSVLPAGTRVVVRCPLGISRTGTVDEVSKDATLIWVWLDGIGRILVTKNDGMSISTV
ncbi:hypothetical protein [Paenarthrobacter sp. NPDC058040]|uniref:hypothetical protein n=1 Tax=unclassified Paenarthrobacter TaxID=2634190 RepID=UPI0036D93D57